MSIYEIVYMVTIPIYLVSIYKLNYCLLGERLYSKKIEISSYLIYAICLSFMYIEVRIPIVLLIFNLISFFLISLNYYGTILNRVVCTFSLYIFLFIIEIFITALTGYLKISAFDISEYNSIIGIILARILMLMLTYLLHKYKKSKIKNFPVPIYYYIAHIFILVGVLYLFLVSLEKELLSITQVIISSSIVLLVNVLIIFVDEKIYDIMIINNERNLLKQQNISYENQAEIMNRSLSTIKSLKHDMKNHIITLKSIYKNGMQELFDEYTDKILFEICDNKIFSHSDNFIIDSILNYKLQELDGLQVSIKLDISIPQNLNVLAYDLTVILGNLLDNAITAIKQTKNDKKLSLCMHITKGSLVVLIDNSYNGRLNFLGEKFRTTKISKENHGIGLENVQNTILNYNGELQISYTEDMFSVAILIPNIY